MTLFSEFTKREKIILLVVLLMLLIALEFPWLLNPDYELFYLLFIVLPLGIFILTDQERITRLKGQ
jgi:hypothetical protein